MKRLPNATGAKDTMERIRVNEELDHSINNLIELKNKYKTKDPNYFIDPAQGEKSRFVEYNPDMYSIDLGTPKCMSAVCVTNDDLKRFRINPNTKDMWRPSEEQFTLNPKSNQLVSKWELDQRQQFKIFPHMFSAQTDLINEANKPRKGGIERGGVDYPIPMRFQLRYLQQPHNPHNGTAQGVDYDVHIRSNNNNVPNSSGQLDFSQKFQNLRSPGTQRCNMQRGIVDRNLADYRLDRRINKFGEIPMKNEYRRAGRTAGVYDIPKNLIEHQQCEREKRHVESVRSQPYTWYKDKGIPRKGYTYSTRNKPKDTATVTRARAPHPSAQNSSFFGLGPPLPPPNPELLSAVNSDLLAKLESTGNPEVDRYIEQRENAVPMQQTLKRHDSIKGLTKASIDPIILPADLEWGLGNQRAVNDSVRLFENSGGGVEERFDGGISNQRAITQQPRMMNSRSQCQDRQTLQTFQKVQEETQLMPEPVEKNSIHLKRQAIERINYQLAHLDRVLPLTRRRQTRAKDTSHIIDIHKTTNLLKEIEAKQKKLRLMKQRLQEELAKLPLDQQEKFAPEPELRSLHHHFFGSTAFGVGSFYPEESFGGNQITLTEGFYDFPQVGGIGNNNLRSFKIPKDMILYLYTKPGKQGIRLKYTGPVRITRLPSRYSRQISGIELLRSVPPYSCSCFDGPAFQGTAFSLRSGFHDFPHVGGVGNRKLASFKIPEQLMITLYSRPNKSGDKLTYIGPVEVPYLPKGWKNMVSGIEIQIKK